MLLRHDLSCDGRVYTDDGVGRDPHASSKRFMRFGRRQQQQHELERIADDDDQSMSSDDWKRFMRFGREFMRFGRDNRRQRYPDERT